MTYRRPLTSRAIPRATRDIRSTGAPSLTPSLKTGATVVWVQQTAHGLLAFQHGVRFVRPEPALALYLGSRCLPAPAEAPRQPVPPHPARHGAHGGRLRSYEVLIKFSTSVEAEVKSFLAAHFRDLNVTETKDPAVLVAYGRFVGDLEHLNSALAELRQSAMVIVGDPQASFIDFFVSVPHHWRCKPGSPAFWTCARRQPTTASPSGPCGIWPRQACSTGSESPCPMVGNSGRFCSTGPIWTA